MSKSNWVKTHQDSLTHVMHLFHQEVSSFQKWLDDHAQEDDLALLLDTGEVVQSLSILLPCVDGTLIHNHADDEPNCGALIEALRLVIDGNQDLSPMQHVFNQQHYHALEVMAHQKNSSLLTALVHRWVDVFTSLHHEGELRAERQSFQHQLEESKSIQQLFEWVRQGDVVKAQTLMAEKGLSVHHYDFEGFNLLMTAILSGSLEMVQAILGHCPHLEDENHEGNTALMVAITQNQAEVVSILLDLGSNLMHQNQDGDHALMLAIKMHNHDLVHQLLEHGALVVDAASMGFELVDYVHELGDMTLMDMLLKAYLQQSVMLDQTSHYHDDLFAILVEHQDRLVSLLKANGFDALGQDKRKELFTKLLHPYHAMGKVFWYGYDAENIPEVVSWLEDQLIHGSWEKAA